VLVLIGLYCVAVKPNLIKKIIGLSLFTDSIHILLVSGGFREGGIAPILTLDNLFYFPQYAVDALPQAFILTSIVIDLSTTALAMSMIIFFYKHFKTINTEKVKELKG
jgi:multicomponent Na+:H+ antiporter subunit C